MWKLKEKRGRNYVNKIKFSLRNFRMRMRSSRVA
jgi:hypothetical protein